METLNYTHTLDWEHIWQFGACSAVRLYLMVDNDLVRIELVSARHLHDDGSTSLLTPAQFADVARSFSDNFDSTEDFFGSFGPVPGVKPD